MRRPPKETPKTDAIGRRFKHERKSTKKRVDLVNTDVLWFEFLHRHGDLPTPFLYEYTKHLRKNYTGVQKRLGYLFHESNTAYKGAYIDRDFNQWKTRNSDYHTLVHRVNKRSKAVLEHAGMLRDNVPKTSSSWTHDFLRSCYSASIHLACLREPDQYEYMHHDQIVDKIGMDSFEVDGETFVPDLIYGIRYKADNSVRLFMVEVDCNTEQLHKTRKNRTKNFEHKLEVYKKYIGGGIYKNDFHITGGLMLVTLTTNPTHMDNLIGIAEEMFTKGSSYMLFNYVDGFDFYFVPPNEIFPHFDEPWLRPGRCDFQMNAA